MDTNYIKKYTKRGQSVYACQYVVSFCTKYKRKIFEEDDLEVLEKSFKRTADECNFIIHNMSLEPNRVILVLELSDPKFSVYSAIVKLKNNSREDLINYKRSFKSRIPCIWTREELVTTVGSYSEREIKKFTDLQDNYVESISKHK